MSEVAREERGGVATGRLLAAYGVHAAVIGSIYMCLPPLFQRIALMQHWSLLSVEQAWSFIPLGSCGSALMTGTALGRHSERTLFRLSAVVVLAALALVVVAEAYWMFAFGLALFGFGTGALLVLLTDRTSRRVHETHRGLVQAFFFCSYAIGAAIGLSTSEIFATALGGWRGTLMVWATLAIALLLCGYKTADPSVHFSEATRKRASLASPVWRYCLTYATYVGGYLGLAGFLPTQLRHWGWPPSMADATLACSTLAFIVGAMLWGSLADRIGSKANIFMFCMISCGVCTILIPSVSSTGPAWESWMLISGVGLFSSAMAVFFPLLIEDPRIDRDSVAFSVGASTAASYVGGFSIPFLVAPLFLALPEIGALLLGASFGCAALLLPRRPS